jgi:hypothetical protein
MARIIAEIGLKPLFEDIRRILYKKQSEILKMKINGVWMDVSPSKWRELRTTKVNVGLGFHTREKKLLASTDIIQLQEKLKSTGYEYITPVHVHNAISDRMEAHGLHVDKYFANPQTYKPPQKGPPMELQIKQAELQLQQQKLQIDQKKSEIEGQVKILLAQSREREMETKRQMEELKGTLQLQRMQVDEQNQIMRATTDQQRSQFEFYIEQRKQEWKEAEETWSLKLQRQENEMDGFKAKLSAATSLEEKMMDIEQRTLEETQKHMREMMKIFREAQMQDQQRRSMIIDFINQNGSDKIKGLASKLN